MKALNPDPNKGMELDDQNNADSFNIGQNNTFIFSNIYPIFATYDNKRIFLKAAKYSDEGICYDNRGSVMYEDKWHEKIDKVNQICFIEDEETCTLAASRVRTVVLFNAFDHKKLGEINFNENIKEILSLPNITKSFYVRLTNKLYKINTDDINKHVEIGDNINLATITTDGKIVFITNNMTINIAKDDSTKIEIQAKDNISNIFSYSNNCVLVIFQPNKQSVLKLGYIDWISNQIIDVDFEDFFEGNDRNIIGASSPFLPYVILSCPADDIGKIITFCNNKWNYFAIEIELDNRLDLKNSIRASNFQIIYRSSKCDSEFQPVPSIIIGSRAGITYERAITTSPSNIPFERPPEQGDFRKLKPAEFKSAPRNYPTITPKAPAISIGKSTSQRKDPLTMTAFKIDSLKDPKPPKMLFSKVGPYFYHLMELNTQILPGLLIEKDCLIYNRTKFDGHFENAFLSQTINGVIITASDGNTVSIFNSNVLISTSQIPGELKAASATADSSAVFFMVGDGMWMYSTRGFDRVIQSNVSEIAASEKGSFAYINDTVFYYDMLNDTFKALVKVPFVQIQSFVGCGNGICGILATNAKGQNCLSFCNIDTEIVNIDLSQHTGRINLFANPSVPFVIVTSNSPLFEVYNVKAFDEIGLMSFDAVHFPLIGCGVSNMVVGLNDGQMELVLNDGRHVLYSLSYSEDSLPRSVIEMRTFPKQRKFEEQIKGMNFDAPIFSFQSVKDIRNSVYSLSSVIAHSHMNKVFDESQQFEVNIIPTSLRSIGPVTVFSDSSTLGVIYDGNIQYYCIDGEVKGLYKHEDEALALVGNSILRVSQSKAQILVSDVDTMTSFNNVCVYSKGKDIYLLGDNQPVRHDFHTIHGCFYTSQDIIIFLTEEKGYLTVNAYRKDSRTSKELKTSLPVAENAQLTIQYDDDQSFACIASSVSSIPLLVDVRSAEKLSVFECASNATPIAYNKRNESPMDVGISNGSLLIATREGSLFTYTIGFTESTLPRSFQSITRSAKDLPPTHLFSGTPVQTVRPDPIAVEGVTGTEKEKEEEVIEEKEKISAGKEEVDPFAGFFSLAEIDSEPNVIVEDAEATVDDEIIGQKPVTETVDLTLKLPPRPKVIELEPEHEEAEYNEDEEDEESVTYFNLEEPLPKEEEEVIERLPPKPKLIKDEEEEEEGIEEAPPQISTPVQENNEKEEIREQVPVINESEEEDINQKENECVQESSEEEYSYTITREKESPKLQVLTPAQESEPGEEESFAPKDPPKYKPDIPAKPKPVVKKRQTKYGKLQRKMFNDKVTAVINPALCYIKDEEEPTHAAVSQSDFHVAVSYGQKVRIYELDYRPATREDYKDYDPEYFNNTRLDTAAVISYSLVLDFDAKKEVTRLFVLGALSGADDEGGITAVCARNKVALISPYADRNPIAEFSLPSQPLQIRRHPTGALYIVTEKNTLHAYRDGTLFAIDEGVKRLGICAEGATYVKGGSLKVFGFGHCETIIDEGLPEKAEVLSVCCTSGNFATVFFLMDGEVHSVTTRLELGYTIHGHSLFKPDGSLVFASSLRGPLIAVGMGSQFSHFHVVDGDLVENNSEDVFATLTEDCQTIELIDGGKYEKEKLFAINFQQPSYDGIGLNAQILDLNAFEDIPDPTSDDEDLKSRLISKSMSKSVKPVKLSQRKRRTYRKKVDAL